MKDILNKLAGKLPDDYEVSISIENGYAGITIQITGEYLHDFYDDTELDWTQRLESALNYATVYHEKESKK